MMDYIQVPCKEQFNDIMEFYSTLFHEMVHSTGHGDRLGRLNTGVKLASFGSEEYSKEELIAEITAEMLCAELHIPDDSETPENAVAYIHSWSSYLQDRPNEIVSAAAKAETACDLIMECLREMELEEQKLPNEDFEEER
jgi:antirestriction protein ArdC